MIPVNQALEIIRAEIESFGSERIELSKALGRVLRQDVVADCDLPPFNRSQMDGYAVRSVDTTDAPLTLRLVGEAAAGSAWKGELKAGEAVRIMTGAPVPVGADAVQRLEVAHESADKTFVEINEVTPCGQFIIERASEVREGVRVLAAGERITANMVATLASFGYDTVDVGKRPHVAIMATGAELVPPGVRPAESQIRDSNSHSIEALVQLAGGLPRRLPIVGDNPAALKLAISEAIQDADVVILSGGVSVGDYDFTKPVLRELGAQIFFERVRVRPGKPTVFAKINDVLIFGLPGNPVSAAVTFNLFARPALLWMQGTTDATLRESRALLSHRVKSARERTSYLPARIKHDDDGRSIVEPLKWGGSSDFVSFARAEALIVVPADVGTLNAHTPVNILHLP
ncbi:MAG: molybdopterin molybdotransferase MoeA [Pyrinomonadaceae bacterium MAG19_C2-C3]|nr:molybdopterin molybdotransferase MoeA [Pyrinomonadaceae bacterium MAG19_C2-C3]